ncbi:MAG: calcium-binding protein, partial [Chloroflexi bacterium]
VLRLDLNFDLTLSESYPFNLDLQDLADVLPSAMATLISGLSNLVGVTASGNLSVEATANLNIALGLDFSELSNIVTAPDSNARKAALKDGFFLYTDDPSTTWNNDPFDTSNLEGTKLVLGVTVAGTDLFFNAKIGPLDIFVKDGEASLTGAFAVALNDIGASPDQHLTLGEILDCSGAGNCSQIIKVFVDGNGNVTLPLYFPTETIYLGDFDLQIVSLRWMLTCDRSSSTPATEDDCTYLADEANFTQPYVCDFANPATNNCPSFTLSTPSLDALKALLPSSPLGLMLNPAVVLDGLDRLLIQLQDWINLLYDSPFGSGVPLIGDTLYETGQFISNFRADVLSALISFIPGNDEGGIAGAIRMAIYQTFCHEGDSGTDELGNTYSCTGITIDDFTFGQLGLLKQDGSLGAAAGTLTDIVVRNEDGNSKDDSFICPGNLGNPNYTDDFCQIEVFIGQTLICGPDPEGAGTPNESRDCPLPGGTLPTLDFDLGIPGLGFDIENLSAVVTFDWNLFFGFGVNLDDGFYFLTEVPSSPTPADTPELRISANAQIPTDACLDGRLAILALKIRPHNTTDPFDPNAPNCNITSPANGSTDNKVELNFVVNLRDPNADGKMTFSEIVARSTKFSNVFDWQLNGQAILDLDIVVAFDPTLSGQTNPTFPSVSSNFFFQWKFIYDPSWAANGRSSATEVLGSDMDSRCAESFNGAPYTGNDIPHPMCIVFRDVTLDTGDFIGQFVGPIVQKVADIVEPLEWLIGDGKNGRDLGILRTPIPVISDLAGQDITILTLLTELEQNVQDPRVKVIKFLNAVVTIYDLVNLVADASNDDGTLNFGSFNLKDFTSADLSQMDKMNGTDGPSLQSQFDFQQIQSNTSGRTLGSADFSGGNGSAQSFFNKATTIEGASIDFPILNPGAVFSILMGDWESVTFVRFQLPKFNFFMELEMSYPVFGPLVAYFRGELSASATTALAYDGYGLGKFMDSKDPIDLFDGFYIDDLDQNGVDIPELTASFTIAAGAKLDILVASAGVEGGITLTADMNLSDPNNDGKIRMGEFVAGLDALFTGGGPPCPFDFTLSSEWFFRAYYKINLLFTSISKSMDLGRGELFPPQTFNCQYPPVLGAVSTQNGEQVLTLNMGPFAANRLTGNFVDGDESMTLTPGGTNGVIVSFGGDTLTFDNIDRVIAKGGLGNDTLDASALNIPVEFDGGAGNDILRGGNASDIIIGGEGNDIIDGNGGNDILEGGVGNDTMNGGAGDDTVDGGAGDDFVEGGDGNDIIIGGVGNDTLEGDSGHGHDTYIFENDWGNDTIIDTPDSTDWLAPTPIYAETTASDKTQLTGDLQIKVKKDGVVTVITVTAGETSGFTTTDELKNLVQSKLNAAYPSDTPFAEVEFGLGAEVIITVRAGDMLDFSRVTVDL